MKRRRKTSRWARESYSYLYGFAPYVSVASRRAQSERELGTLRKKGRTVAPVTLEGRKIATTFWGESWCDNLERYSDFANRLPRGRSYVRSGAVVDLQIAPGVVTALVSGSDLYTVRVAVTELPAARWRGVCRDVSGAIDSVIELLQGQLSERVMTRLCADGTGLFPSPREINFECSCPDAAFMCKHVAAALYGVGARLDREPGLLFTLRQVKEAELVGGAGAQAAASLVSGRGGAPRSRRIADESALADVFGIEMAKSALAEPVAEAPASSPSKSVAPAQPAGARVKSERASARKPVAARTSSALPKDKRKAARRRPTIKKV